MIVLRYFANGTIDRQHEPVGSFVVGLFAVLIVIFVCFVPFGAFGALTGLFVNFFLHRSKCWFHAMSMVILTIVCHVILETVEGLDWRCNRTLAQYRLCISRNQWTEPFCETPNCQPIGRNSNATPSPTANETPTQIAIAVALDVPVFLLKPVLQFRQMTCENSHKSRCLYPILYPAIQTPSRS